MNEVKMQTNFLAEIFSGFMFSTEHSYHAMNIVKLINFTVLIVFRLQRLFLAFRYKSETWQNFHYKFIVRDIIHISIVPKNGLCTFTHTVEQSRETSNEIIDVRANKTIKYFLLYSFFHWLVQI